MGKFQRGKHLRAQPPFRSDPTLKGKTAFPTNSWRWASLVAFGCANSHRWFEERAFCRKIFQSSNQFGPVLLQLLLLSFKAASRSPTVPDVSSGRAGTKPLALKTSAAGASRQQKKTA